VAKYVEGEHTYENINGKIYKNGRLVPEKDYKYIPTAIGGTRDGTPSTSPTLRDFIAGQGGTVGYDPSSNQVQVSLGGNTLSFGSGQGQQYGLGGLSGGQNVVADPNKLLQALGQVQKPPDGTMLGAGAGMMPSQYDIMQQLQDYYKKQEQAQLQNLLNQRDEGIRALEGQRGDITRAANRQRTQAEVNAQMDAKRLRAVLANMGWIGDSQSGQTRTDLGRVQGDLQQALSTIGQHEMAQQGNISERISNLKLASGNDIAAMQAALAADQAQALWQQMNQDRNFGYQASRDQIADQRYQQEWDWQTSPNNPSYQAQMLQNQIRQLELQNMPAQQQLQLQLLKQQLQAGQIDMATAQERLQQLKNPSLQQEQLSPTQQAAQDKLIQSQNQAEADRIVDNISYEFGADFKEKYGTWIPWDDKAEAKKWKKAIMGRIAQLAEAGVSPEVLDLVRQSFGISDMEALELLGG
jgi:hypothetical protein